MKPAILFLVFNRPSTTKLVFERIRQAQPSRLYIAADGSREYKQGEQLLCQEVRAIATAVDWDCKVETLFRDKNLGCKMAVSNAITWFFKNEEEGIILEDDVLPLPSFFNYCEELLERYRYDENVALISGNNLISKQFSVNDSYFFSHYANIWGWASWRRVWQKYDVGLKSWPDWYNKGGLKNISDNVPFFDLYWKDQIDAIYNGKMDTWDFQLFFTCWRLNALCVVPINNLTSNLGFGELATHTTGKIPTCVSESVPEELTFPLKHPANVVRISQADVLMSRLIFNINIFTILKWKIRRIPFLGNFLAKVKAVFSLF